MPSTVLLVEIAAVAVFAGVSLTDLRTRTAPNAAWVILLGLGAARAALAGVGLAEVVGTVLVAVIVFAIGAAAYRRGWGGAADVKAMAALPVAIPKVPGKEAWSGVFGTLLQGFEVVFLVFTFAGIVGFSLTVIVHHSKSERGVPFLVAVFAGVVALFVA